MVTLGLAAICSATLIFLSKTLPNSFTININKRIILPDPPPAPTLINEKGYVKAENDPHSEVLKAINDIMTEFNGGDHVK